MRKVDLWHTNGSVNVLPGSKVAKMIICPKTPPVVAAARIKVDWPPDLSTTGLCVLTTFKHVGLTYQVPLRWHLLLDSTNGTRVQKNLEWA